MASSEITLKVNVEGLLQKELTRIVSKINDDHGIMLENISFEWVKMSNGRGNIISCKTESTYYP